MPNLALFCDLQRLLPTYVAGFVDFSLNLSVAVEKGAVTKDDLEFLTPWTWKIEGHTMRMYGITGGVASKKPITTQIVSPMGLTPAGWFESLASVRDRFSDEGENLDERFAWNAKLKQDGNKLPWYALLLQASNFPDVLPYAANLAFVLRVPAAQLTNVDEVIAVPSFRFKQNGDLFEPKALTADLPIKENSDPIAVSTLGSAFYSWIFATASAEVAIKSFQHACLVTPEVKKRFLRLDKGWVLLPEGENAPAFIGEDWTTRLEPRLEDAFDLAQRLIDVIRNKGKKEPWLMIARHAAMAALRDAAGMGVDEDGVGAAHDVFLRASDAATWKAIEPVLKAHRGMDMPSWEALAAAVTSIATAAPEESDEEKRHLAVVQQLSSLAGALADPATLREIVFRQWDAALQSDAATKLLWTKSLQDRVRKDLEEHSFRRRLLRENLMNAWRLIRKIDDKTKDLDQLQAQLADALTLYFTDRFLIDAMAGVSFDHYTPQFKDQADVEVLRNQVLPLFKQAVVEFAKQYIDVIAGDASSNAPPETSVPDGIVIQVDRVAGLGDDAGTGTDDDQADLLRRIAGVGLLLRRANEPWCCLNYATIETREVPPHGEAETATVTTIPRAVVASRLAYRNGIRQAFVVYNNQPLVAESPMNVISEGRIEGNSGVAGDLTASFFRYANCYGKTGPKLPPLVYGATYDAAAFIVGNAGALPPELAVAGKPWEMIDPATIDNAAIDTFIRKGFRYRRRVPVGAVRIGKGERGGNRATAFENLDVPPIPATVAPIARSLPPASTDEPNRPLLLLRDPSGPLDRWSLSAAKRFPFAIRPPSVDLAVWDRWVAADGVDVATRQKVWGEFYEGADRFGTSLNAKNQIDLSLDDPAVATFRLTLRRIFGSSAGSDTHTLDFDLGAPRGNSGLARFQRTERQVVVEALAPNASASLAEVANIAVVRVPAGEVWRLSIDLQVPDASVAEATSKFDKRVCGSNTLPPSYELDIEVATSSMPKPSQLDAALRLDAEVDHDLVKVVLSAPAVSSEWIHRTEVMLQQWRWGGRPFSRDEEGQPVYGFPFDDIDSGVADGQLFADRESSDHLVLPTHVDFIKANKPKVLESRDVSGNPGALYYRAAIRAFSRYEGLLLSSGVDSRRSSDDVLVEATTTTSLAERWQRVIMPSRWRKEVPPPSIRLIVPLTRPVIEMENVNDPALTNFSAAPLLVVCDSPAYDIGGAAEELVAEIANVASPFRPLSEDAGDGTAQVASDPRLAPLPEFGPDPILTLQSTAGAPRPLRVIGPIGYTFDTDTQAPLFIRSSYILPPPTLDPSNTSPDLGWHFAKLRFRRRLAAKGMFDGQSRQSAPTPAVWAQFLPPSTHYKIGQEFRDVAQLRFVIDEARAELRIVDRGKPVVLANDKPTFAFYVLVTSVIADALSRRDQEVFDSLWELDANGVGKRTAGPAGVTGNPLRARIVEVQRRERGGDNLFDDLFPQVAEETLANAADVKARIVRVSPPLDPA